MWAIGDVEYCPFCGGDVDWRNYIRGTCHCIECGAVFSVVEDSESKRPVEDEDDV